ncbi:hypothetical protein SASPL_133433 [Salvia splendens]|uniref:Peptide N-acetyl-beta-D-glucosaminyl asparaginase amidase A N-terminal domain-containing protein n=1 Tax=Salvia splendens TaxID=180675 RepID=A0A8X8ZJ42_SALSN|nr:hypothetical protein SASPL_133433 [Salvia splendens]
MLSFHAFPICVVSHYGFEKNSGASPPPSSYLLLQHDFSFTYGQPSVLTAYTPPPHCPSPSSAKIVLEWTATCKGRQFDRIFGVWIGGAEGLYSFTAEPSAAGIIWTVKKDVTRYSSLLSTNQTLAVYLGNLVDSTYIGVYHVNILREFDPFTDDDGNRSASESLRTQLQIAQR